MGMIVNPYRFGAAALPVPIVTAATPSNWGTLNANPTVPANNIGDLLILLVETNLGLAAPPTGWTEFSGSPQVSSSVLTLNAYYRVAQATNSATITKAQYGDHAHTVILNVTGVNVTFPNAASGATAAAATTVNLPSLTTTAANALILFMVCCGSDVDSTTRYTWTPDASLSSGTELIDFHTSTNGGGGLGVYAATKATAGSIGTSSVTQPSAALAMLTLALVG